MLDYPFDEVATSIIRLSKEGHYCYQKFTCVGCGQRLTMDIPNVIYEEGTCDKCNAVTNIKQHGCNFMLYSGPNPPNVDLLEQLKRERGLL